MEYTVQKLALLSGITPRTLRYYDEIGILKPARINSSGYRIYGETEINILQQILFYRELGIELENIKDMISSPYFDRAKALKDHKNKLLDKRNQLDLLIENIDKTMAEIEGRILMSDKEKFQGFKDKMIQDNEASYGKELREKYGNDTIDKSNNKLKNMTEKQYEEITKLSEEIMEKLKTALEAGDPSSELAQEVAGLHHKWISFYWDSYSKEAHAGLANMYVQDERFKAYYDKQGKGAAEFLRDAILIYTGKINSK
ncbi:MerR family transcriptional regulator [Clostridium sp. 19966]|uniref:MerR family transcriptional regulator n=1 Tax=Clostridium sp. 19966 TaxID=2768166 RepID=UPI0028DED63F|nr:MerR family transcriptional regulator [Clostridium sp. 19966]MDT8715162.1 MerR family transcriptional regulator [Clostridium sp. 19966]